MKAYFACAAAVALTALTGVPVMAAPVAPHPPLSKIGKEMLAAQPGKKVHQCPAAAVVAMPVYRGALCVTNVTTSSNGKQAPIEMLVLVSRDSPARVRGWYGRHLKGWKYDPQIHNFAPPEWSIKKLFSVPQVEIKKATKTNLALYGMAYDLAGMRTLIHIYYLPKGGVRR